MSAQIIDFVEYKKKREMEAQIIDAIDAMVAGLGPMNHHYCRCVSVHQGPYHEEDLLEIPKDD